MKGKPTHRRINIARGIASVSLLLGLGHAAWAVTSFPASGVCGFTLTLNYPFAYLYGSSPGTPFVVNWVGSLDFSARTISANVVLENATAAAITESQGPFSAPFTVAAGPVSGAYTIAFSVNSSAFTLNLIPVNGGNQFLMQFFSPAVGAQDVSAVSVCRM